MVMTRKPIFLTQGPELVLHGAGPRAAAEAGVVAQRRVQATEVCAQHPDGLAGPESLGFGV